MILNYLEYINSGVPTSDDVSQIEVELAIKTVEHYVVKHFLGWDVYKNITQNPSDYEDVINGNEEVVGLKVAIVHIVHSYVLWDRYRVSRFGSVVKKDEYSEHPEEQYLYNVCKQHYEIGIGFLLDCCEFLNIIPQETNHLVFGELFL